MIQSSHSVIHISNLLAIPRRLIFKLYFNRIRQKHTKREKGADVFGLKRTIKIDFCKEENKIQLKKMNNYSSD